MTKQLVQTLSRDMAQTVAAGNGSGNNPINPPNTYSAGGGGGTEPLTTGGGDGKEPCVF